MKFKYKVMLYMTAFLSFFYVVSACLLIFVSFQTSLNKEKANALNTPSNDPEYAACFKGYESESLSIYP